MSYITRSRCHNTDDVAQTNYYTHFLVIFFLGFHLGVGVCVKSVIYNGVTHLIPQNTKNV